MSLYHNNRDIQLTSGVSTQISTSLLQEVKDFLREDRDVEDGVIETLIKTAITNLEARTGNVLRLTDFTLHVSQFSDIKLPKKPIVDGSVVVKYDDKDAVEQTLDTSLFNVYTQESPASVEFENDLPSVSDTKYPVRLEFQAGYNELPDHWKTAVKMVVLTLHRRRIPENDGENLGIFDLRLIKDIIDVNTIGRFK